jgi:hypothetical protein
MKDAGHLKRSHRGMIPYLYILVYLHLCAASSASLIISLDSHPASGLNTLDIVLAINAPVEQRIYETSGAVLNDRIDLRLPEDITFEPVSTLTDWSWQQTLVTEDATVYSLVTYYYEGVNQESPNEFYSFLDPFSLSFKLRQVVEPSPSTVELAVAVWAAAVVPGSGLIPTTTHAVFQAVPEPVALSLIFMIGVGMLVAKRFVT